MAPRLMWFLRSSRIVGLTVLFVTVGQLSVDVMPALAASSTVQSVINNGTPVITNPTPPTQSGGGSSTITTPTPTPTPTPSPTTTTNSSTTVSGSATPDTSLTVQDNDSSVANTNSDSDGTFSVSVPLTTGQNIITVRPTYDYQHSTGTSATTAPAEVSQPVVITREPTVFQRFKKVSFYVAGSIISLVVVAWIALQVLGLFRLRRKRRP